MPTIVMTPEERRVFDRLERQSRMPPQSPEEERENARWIAEHWPIVQRYYQRVAATWGDS